MGYELLDVHEVWDFEESEGGLFAEYVDAWLKIKTEASGWPAKTWCTPEIQKAKRIGYELKTVHEVWHFEKTKVGLFADYVDTWLKLKQESAGWSAECNTEEEKRRFIDEFDGSTLHRHPKSDPRRLPSRVPACVSIR